MSSLTSLLTDIVSNAFAESGYDRAYGEVHVSDRPDLAQFQCNGSLAAAKANKANPREIGQKVADVLTNNDAFGEVSLAGPGFINLKLTDKFLTAHTQNTANDDRLGVDSVSTPQKIVIDYGGPNVAKPMHVG
ncbi:MAG: arginine--tRNA ligase, partial [Gemmatimonadetes bacterium]|nr:arginine--tRNA ligase [Gemmatimonadota bacterium]